MRKISFPKVEDKLCVVMCEIENREDLREEDISMLWFARSDYHFSRSAARAISREEERNGTSKNLNGVFNEKSKEKQNQLNRWVLHGYSRRGLERWANCFHGEERHKAQFNAIMEVLSAQDDMLATSKQHQVDDEALRKVSVKCTRVARHFARMIGKADAYAASSELQDDKDTILTNAADAKKVPIRGAVSVRPLDLNRISESRKR